jgi:hypothetical protein
MSDTLLQPKGLLITRQAAKQYRNHIVNLLERAPFVIVDLSGIELITPSYADECFGILGQMYGKEGFRQRIKFRGASKDVKHLISVVLANRLERNTSAGPSEATEAV